MRPLTFLAIAWALLALGTIVGVTVGDYDRRLIALLAWSGGIASVYVFREIREAWELHHA